MLNILGLAGGVDHQEIILARPAGNNQVVQHTTGCIGKQGVGLLVIIKTQYVSRHQSLQHLSAGGPREQQLAHMRHIE